MTSPLVPRAPVGSQTSESLAPASGPVVPAGLSRNAAVLRIAWPVALANFLQSLALTVDLIFLGRLGPAPMAAAGIASQVFMLMTALAAGLSAGALALVARALGAGDARRADRTATLALILSFAASLPLTVLLVAGARPLLSVLGGDPTVLDDASRFLAVLSIGLPFQFVVLAATGALAGAGDTRPALYVNLAINAVNVGLDWIFIFGNLGAPRVGLLGAAIATTSSYAVGALFFVAVLFSGRRPLRFVRAAAASVDRELATGLVTVGGPAALEQLLLGLGFTLYLFIILRFGASALDAHYIGLRVQSFAFLPGFGFASGAAALVGQRLGAGKPEEAARDGWAAMRLALGIMIAMSAFLFVLATPLARLFSDDTEAVRLGTIWIRLIVLAMPAIAIHFTAAGALRGAGDTRWPLMVSFVGIYVLRLPLSWLLAITLGWGMYGVWFAYITEYYARAIITAWRFRIGKWKTIRVPGTAPM
ncbi:MAG: MATE family efflux transporter [Thermoplasmatota archaeon]